MKYNFTLHELDVITESKWLSDRERKVLALYYVRGWHIETIAAELDVSRGTIDNILRSIRNKAEYILGDRETAVS